MAVPCRVQFPAWVFDYSVHCLGCKAQAVFAPAPEMRQDRNFRGIIEKAMVLSVVSGCTLLRQ